MAASSKRRSRYAPDTAQAPTVPTGSSLLMATLVGRFGPMITPQLVRLSGKSLKSVQRSARHALDAGVLSVVAIPRLALADPETALTPGLGFGSAPNLFVLTPHGRKLLIQKGLLPEETPVPTVPTKQSLFFLQHRLFVTDLHIFFARSASACGHELLVWHEGKSAEIILPGAHRPSVRPDAWAVYRVGNQALVACIECDRGTERGGSAWERKLTEYAAVFASRQLARVTGYQNARLLVITLTTARRDQLASLIAKTAPQIAPRIWLADRSVLDIPDLTEPQWMQPGSLLVKSLLPRQADK